MINRVCLIAWFRQATCPSQNITFAEQNRGRGKAEENHTLIFPKWTNSMTAVAPERSTFCFDHMSSFGYK